MLLSDFEYKSEMVIKAMNDGIKTDEEYSYWVIGYMTGYTDRQEEVLNQIKGGLKDDKCI